MARMHHGGLFIGLVVSTALAPRPSTAALPNLENLHLEDLEQTLRRSSNILDRGDLDEVRKRGVLRVLTRNNSSAYFVVRGGEEGFQYELAKAFADELGVRVEFVVPPARSALVDMLLSGAGDLIAPE